MIDKEILERLFSEVLHVERTAHFKKALELKKAEPEPSGTSFEEWEGQERSKAQMAIQEMGENLGVEVAKEVQATFSDEPITAAFDRIFRREPLKLLDPVLRLAYVSAVRKSLEESSLKMGLDRRAEEIRQLQKQIVEHEREIPKPFDPGWINVKRYPKGVDGKDRGLEFPIGSRVQQQGDKYVDLWLTQALDSPEPVYFLPHEQWLSRLIEFFDKVYRPYAEAERLKNTISPLKKIEAPAEPVAVKTVGSMDLPSDFKSARREFAERNEEEELSVSERIHQRVLRTGHM